MAEKGQDIYSSISSKIQIILERQTRLVEAVREARAERDALQSRVNQLTAEVNRLKADLEYMAVGRAIAPSPQQIADSRAMLSGLIREIDRCITELKAC